MKLIFPDVFITGEVDDKEEDRILCAHGFIGWANCHAGCDIPDNFGLGMVAIGKRLKIAPTEDNLTKLATKKGWLK